MTLLTSHGGRKIRRDAWLMGATGRATAVVTVHLGAVGIEPTGNATALLDAARERQRESQSVAVGFFARPSARTSRASCATRASAGSPDK